MMKRLSVALAMALFGLAPAARADIVRLDSLPEGSPLPLPLESDRPDDIAASSHSDRIFPALPPPDQLVHMTPGAHYVRIFPTRDLAEAHAQKGLGAMHDESQLCFSVADAWFLKQDDRDWPLNADPQPSIHAVKKGTPAARHYHEPMVRAVRLDALTVDPSGTASLTMLSAWVDPLSLGVQHVASGTLKLARVAEAYGVTVLAARDPGGDAVHFVVRQERPEGRLGMFVGRHMQVRRADTAGHSSCGMSVLTLRALAGGGQQATVELDALLAVEESEPQEPDAGRGILGILGADRAAPTMREMRVRTMQVHLAVSQASGDASPIVTVSFGWFGKERRQQFF